MRHIKIDWHNITVCYMRDDNEIDVNISKSDEQYLKSAIDSWLEHGLYTRSFMIEDEDWNFVWEYEVLMSWLIVHDSDE